MSESKKDIILKKKKDYVCFLIITAQEVAGQIYTTWDYMVWLL